MMLPSWSHSKNNRLNDTTWALPLADKTKEEDYALA